METRSSITLFSLPNELIAYILEYVPMEKLLTIRRCRQLKPYAEKVLSAKAREILSTLPKLPVAPKGFDSVRSRQIIAEYAAYNNSQRQMMCKVFEYLESFISNNPKRVWSIDFKQTLHKLLTNPEVFAIRPDSRELSEDDEKKLEDIQNILLFQLDPRASIRISEEGRYLIFFLSQLVIYYKKCWGEGKSSLLSRRWATKTLHTITG